MKKPAFTLVLCLLLALLTMLRSYAAAADALPHITPAGTDTLDVPCAAAILIDEDSGTVLYEKNADQQRPIASITKVMTLLLTFEALSAGRISLSDTVPVSEHAYHMGGSQIWLEPGEQMTLDDMLKAICISSANDAAVAVAEFVGGSAPSFVNMMNAKARMLGMRDSRFRNPHGLPAQGQYTTARDMLTLARAYLRAYPWALKFHNTHVLNHQGRVTWNKNPLLGQYPGADGLKTGWVNASGYNLIFTASRGDKRLLAVILGAPDVRVRGTEACRLLDAGFQVCGNQAVSVAAALTQMPQENYRLDLRKTAHEAGRQYAQAQPEVRKQAKHGSQNKYAKNKKHKNRKAVKQRVSRPQHSRQAAQNSRPRAS